MINSFQKGKRKELEAVHLIEKLTKEKWRRMGGREFDKIAFSGDIRPLNNNSFYSRFSWEVKARKQQNIKEWLDKAIFDDKIGIAILCSWDETYKRWIISLEFEKFIRILEELRGYCDN